ncbi:CHAP domain-containing protein [bacterium]|nr:CHAP domain-containing protein [bacterium]
MVSQISFKSFQRDALMRQLQYSPMHPNNPQKNWSHLSVQNLSDILSGKAYPNYYGIGSPYTGKQKKYFAERSQDLMYKIPHKTKLLNVAQSYVGQIIEVTPEEYKRMSYADRQKTQGVVIGPYGTIEEAWCAHTVSFLCEQAGINIGGHKKGVQQFIDWGTQKGIYRPIKTNIMTKDNYVLERSKRAAQIRQQTKQMKEGDLIVWKSDTVHTTQFGINYCNASHIGIIECVNEDGTVSVIEGNANEPRTGTYERYVATNDREKRNGNQSCGESQELNPRDGLIRKVYTVEELAANGYSGYINMQGLVK